MRIALLLALSGVLTACNSIHAARDDAECQSYGLAAGTPEYANCRLQLQQIGAQRAANAVNAYNSVRANRVQSCAWNGAAWQCY